jgi:hypothetical protein
MGGVHKWGTPIAGWFTMENPMKMFISWKIQNKNE